MVLPVELFKEMRQWDLSPGVKSYSAAISACEKGFEWVLPLELFREMRQWELSPDVTSYSAAISTCEKGSEWCCQLSSSRRCGSENLVLM